MTGDDKQLLYFEREHPTPGGVKDQAIRAQFDISPTLYHQRLMALLDDPDAYLFDPQLIKRLRRLRDHRRHVRASA